MHVTRRASLMSDKASFQWVTSTTPMGGSSQMGLPLAPRFIEVTLVNKKGIIVM